jgi:ribonuclease J
MATKAQIAANRKNAQKSTGPKTPEGREAVRLAVRRCATLWTGKKPVVEVMLLQVA